ncbi:Mast cell protease 1A [Lonchura striata]|uniref:Mast cell protease 1A n=1 Tax=Lonchura striata TaxID=40157 RepID=A0A218UG37_9PASE|nr:Mast cell protease 1A [Lonchura striata domestica]
MCQPQPLPALLLLLCCAWASASSLRGRIVGGHEARPHSHPYMAFLKFADMGGCGGFLVAPNWVMSAAHCMGNITVILGAHNIHEPEKTQQVRGVLKYHEHPEYNPSTMENDIMLLQARSSEGAEGLWGHQGPSRARPGSFCKAASARGAGGTWEGAMGRLTSKVAVNDYVQPIPLPRTGSDLPTGTKCVIAGWGLIDEDRTTNKLFETKVSIYSRRKCSLFYPNLDSGMVCAGSFHELKDSSQGDSGGPLVCNKVAQGIVSFGYDSPPGVYTRISNYLPWIKKVMKK